MCEVFGELTENVSAGQAVTPFPKPSEPFASIDGMPPSAIDMRPPSSVNRRPMERAE